MYVFDSGGMGGEVDERIGFGLYQSCSPVGTGGVECWTCVWVAVVENG